MESHSEISRRVLTDWLYKRHGLGLIAGRPDFIAPFETTSVVEGLRDSLQSSPAYLGPSQSIVHAGCRDVVGHEAEILATDGPSMTDHRLTDRK